MILPHTDVAGALALGQHVCSAVEALHLPHSGSTVGAHVTISIGATSVVPGRTDSMAALVETADKGLYEAKRTGKNRAVLHPYPAHRGNGR